jgi:hypothetical protein
MKTLKILSLFALVIMNFTSCDLLFGHHEPETVTYNLYLSFQDASGHDLVKGIRLWEWMPPGASMEDAPWDSIKLDSYVLDITFSEPCKDGDNRMYNPQLSMELLDDGYYYLTSYSGFWIKDCPEQRILTYKLTCPYIFGDEAVHEFVAYWDIPKAKVANEYLAKCYRIEFEGNEIIPKLQPYIVLDGTKHERYTAIITLND